MENTFEFEKIEQTISELKNIESINEKIEKLVEIVSINNKNIKSLYDSHIKTIQSNNRIFEALNVTNLKLIDRSKSTEDWTNAQQELNENLTDKIVDHTNSIQDILKTIDFFNKSLSSLSNITDIFDKRFEILEERIDLL